MKFQDHSFVDKQHPYPGLFPFREEDKDYFFGRQRETGELLEMINDNVLTVLFGKSGIGKTSLLRAGLIPRMRDSYYLPVYIRIAFDNRQKTPLMQVKEIISGQIKELDPGAEAITGITLWEYFTYTRILRGFVQPLLFFDQFEELFTTGKNNPSQANELVTEIADLIENRVPLSLQERLEKEGKTLPLPPGRLGAKGSRTLKVIFSLREDYLPQLETLTRYIPSLGSGRYRISQLKGFDAVEAVLKPGEEVIRDRDVAIGIINKIPGAGGEDYKPYENMSGDWENKKIEPFLLSLFCYRVNEKRLARNAPLISRELIEDVRTEDIIRDFYEENTAIFAANVRTAIEDLLITADGHRKLQDKNSLTETYGVAAETIGSLIDRRIIRKETRLGIDYIELIHDVLAPIVVESRNERKEREKQEAEREQLQKEKELAAGRKKRSRLAFGFITLIAILLGILSYFAFKQKTAAENARDEIESRSISLKAYEMVVLSGEQLDKDDRLAFRLAEAAYSKEKTNPYAYRALLTAFYHLSFVHPLEFGDKDAWSDFFAVFSPLIGNTGAFILTVNSSRAVLWNVQGELLSATAPPAGLRFSRYAAFSADGEKIIILTASRDMVILWERSNNSVKPLLLSSAGDIISAVFSADGQTILTAAYNNVVRLWDLQGKEKRAFTGHGNVVKCALFSPDGKNILSASADGSARMWDLAGTGVLTFSTEGETVPVEYAGFFPDGQWVLTARADGQIKLWNFQADGNGFKIKNKVDFLNLAGVTTAGISPDGNYILVVTRGNSVQLWTRSGIKVYELKEVKDIIRSVFFSPCGNYFLIAQERGPAQVWVVHPAEIIRQANGKGIGQLTAEEKSYYGLLP